MHASLVVAVPETEAATQPEHSSDAILVALLDDDHGLVLIARLAHGW